MNQGSVSRSPFKILRNNIFSIVLANGMVSRMERRTGKQAYHDKAKAGVTMSFVYTAKLNLLKLQHRETGGNSTVQGRKAHRVSIPRGGPLNRGVGSVKVKKGMYNLCGFNQCMGIHSKRNDGPTNAGGGGGRVPSDDV